MEDILAIILIFGGGTLIAVSFSPIGRAVAARIRGGGQDEHLLAEIDALRAQVADVDDLRAQVSELHERVDFAERLLSQEGGGRALPKSSAAADAAARD
ncbi:MAG: hypothetical protein ACREMH_10185 [Gemmatimonadales bacterium]